MTGLGIESTSFRNGLPHESVLEMDVFTGAGEVVTATADNEHADLFDDLPELLRLARLRHPAADRAGAGRRLVALRHVRFDDLGAAGQDDRRDHRDRRAWTASAVDGLDGVVVRARARPT